MLNWQVAARDTAKHQKQILGLHRGEPETAPTPWHDFVGSSCSPLCPASRWAISTPKGDCSSDSQLQGGNGLPVLQVIVYWYREAFAWAAKMHILLPSLPPPPSFFLFLPSFLPSFLSFFLLSPVILKSHRHLLNAHH